MNSAPSPATRQTREVKDLLAGMGWSHRAWSVRTIVQAGRVISTVTRSEWGQPDRLALELGNLAWSAEHRRGFRVEGTVRRSVTISRPLPQPPAFPAGAVAGVAAFAAHQAAERFRLERLDHAAAGNLPAAVMAGKDERAARARAELLDGSTQRALEVRLEAQERLGLAGAAADTRRELDAATRRRLVGRPAGLLSLRQRLENMDTASLRDYVARLEADDRAVEADLRAEARGELTRREQQGQAFASLQAADTRRRLGETRLELAARRAAITGMGAELESLDRRRARLEEAIREEGERVSELMREERRLALPGSSLAGPRQRARLERLAGA